MSRTYFAYHGETMDCNVVANDYLSKMTFGLFDLMGFPSEISQDDCNIIDRMLRNRMLWMEKWGFQNGKINFALPAYEIKYLGEPQRTFFRKFAAFLRASGGLINENEYYELWPQEVDL